MFKSIRWTLQLWHAGLLAVVLAGFGMTSYFELSRSRYREVDAELERSVQTLATNLRFPPRPPRQGGGGPGGGGGGIGGGGGPDFGRRGQQNFPPDSFNGPNGPPDGFDRGGRPNGPDRGFFDGGRRGGRGGPGGGGGGPDGQGFGQRGDPSLAEVEVPPLLAQRFGDGENGTLYYFIWDYDRERVVKSEGLDLNVPDAGPRIGPPFNPPGADQVVFRQRDPWREAYMNGPAGTRILVGRSILPVQAELRRSAWLLGGTGAGVMLIGLLGGWVLSWRVVKPIRAMTTTAQEISATNLSRRIDVADTKSELGTLAAVLNDTFARLDATFQQQVRFTGDASHELRTPLAVIHTNTQLALSRERSAEEYRKTIETCQRASSRMKSLVDSLLVLAKADAGRLSLERTPFDLQDVVQECVTMITSLAQEKGILIESDLRAVELVADPSRIAQVVMNLLTNAIRYNREGGQVRVSIQSSDTEATLTIVDTGMGIPPVSQPHIFERFYRVDAARSREMGGSGLGLAICRSIVEAHGGTITFQSDLGAGTTFTVRLPRKLNEK